MIKIKVAEATPTQLNWLVARCEGKVSDDIDDFCLSVEGEFAYSTDWALGGLIIEREKIETLYFGSYGGWEAQMGGDHHYIDQHPGDAYSGSTPLMAAMNAYVSTKLGDEVEVPASLRGI